MLTALLLIALQLPGDPQPASVAETLQDLATAKVAEVVAEPVALPQESLGSGGSAYTYCEATPHSLGYAAQIGYVGSLDLAANEFTLTVVGCPPVPSSFGMFTYGQAQYNAPFGNGNLCVSPFSPGIFRMAMQPLGAGVLSCGMLARPEEFTLFTPGSSWNFQFWYRNPQALAQGAPSTFNLSNALHVEFAPAPSL